MKDRLLCVLIGVIFGGLVVAVYDRPKYEIHVTNQGDLVRFNPRTGEAWADFEGTWDRILEKNQDTAKPAAQK